MNAANAAMTIPMMAVAMSICTAVILPADYREPMDWVRIFFFFCFGALSIGGWTVTWWWHWLGRGVNLRLAPLLKFFRRSRS